MLFNFIKRIFQQDIQRLLNSKEFEVRQELKLQRESIQLYGLTQHIGMPVIVVPNEWDTPVIGMAVRVEYITQGKCPVLIVKNYIDGVEYMALGKVYAYSSQKLRAVFKLNPFELCSFIYYQDAHQEFNKAIREERLSLEQVVSLLTENGFYQAFDHMLVE